MFRTPSRVSSNDVGYWPRDEPPSKKPCLDNAAAPKLHESSLELASSTSSGNEHSINYTVKRTYHFPVPEGGGYGWSMNGTYCAYTPSFESKDFYKKSGAYDQENISSRGQKALEDSTDANIWYSLSHQAREPNGEYNSYGTTDAHYCSCYEAPREQCGESSVPVGGCAARVSGKLPSYRSMGVHGGHLVSANQFPSSCASNPTMNFEYPQGTRDFDDSSGSERANSYSSSFISKPDQRGRVLEAGYLNNYAGVDVDCYPESSVSSILTNTGVYNSLCNYQGGHRFESTVIGACRDATAPSLSSSRVSGQEGDSGAERALHNNYGYKVRSTFPSGLDMSAVLAGRGSNQPSTYSDDRVSCPTRTLVHAEGLGHAAGCAPEMTPVTLQRSNTFAPAVDITSYPEFNPNFSFLSDQANNHAECNHFGNSTSGHPNFTSSVGLDANVWSGDANTVGHPAYTSEKLACSQSADSAASVAGSDDITGSINAFSSITDNEHSTTPVDGGNENHSPDMSGYVVTGVEEETTVADASVDGSIFGMLPDSTVAGQVGAITVEAEGGSSIVKSDESAAEAGTADADADTGSTGQIGPQAYPSAYQGVLKSLLSHAANAANKPKRKLKWPLPIPLFVKPHDTKLTFNDIDYTWVTHDIQATAQGGVYAQTIDTNGCLQVFVDSARAANNLLHLNYVAGVPVKISVGRNYTDNIGYIRRVPRRYSNTVLFEFLEDQGLLCAKRQIGYMKYDKRHPKDMTTGTVVLLFMPDRPLPPVVTIDKISYEVTRRLQQPLQCFNCQRFGHGSTSCTGPTCCRFCGGPHGFPDCKRRNKPKCVNCNENHASTYWRCPSRLAFASADPRNDWLRDSSMNDA